MRLLNLFRSTQHSVLSTQNSAPEPAAPPLGKHYGAKAEAERAIAWGEIACRCMIQGHVVPAEKAGTYATHWARLALGHTGAWTHRTLQTNKLPTM